MSIRQGSTIIAGSSGSGGTSNYNNLENKPSINGITLEGNKTTEDLNINSLPDQTGNEGKVLITNGTEASWQTLPETGLPLFAHIWSDHLLTNSSYLRADTFSWQDGNIYYTAYNELVNEKNLTTETSTDTINDITITYYRTPKGYKIVLPDMADNLVQLYENTGTAWYYILDIDNTRFKLPRNSRYESGTTTDNAGDFEAETLTNSTNNEINLNHITQFLYFYVGNTIQNETTINIAEITEALNNKVDRDFGNITDDTYDFLTTKQISNCITKLPQDIKLELNNGTLTLKAGSLPTNPVTGDKYTISSDLTLTASSGGNTDCCIFYSASSGTLFYEALSGCLSGDTLTGSGFRTFYNTVDKTIKRYNGSGDVIEENVSLPLAICGRTSSALSSIKQVFNGFGYIGSTIFALPGIEGLIPKGRNPDGSLNSTKFTTTTTSIKTFSGTADVIFTVYTPTGIPTATATKNYYYNEGENYNYFDGNKSSLHFVFANGSFENGRITSFSPNNTFQAVDRNDTEWASTTSKPSDRYIDLTLQANGTTYTAPANGTVYFAKQAGATTPVYLWIENTNSSLSNISWINSDGSGDFTSVSLPVAAGDVFKVYYTAKGNTNYFRFIYDEGSK